VTHMYSRPWLVLKDVLVNAEASFFVASPFISSSGVDFIDDHLPLSTSLKLFSQFTPDNIATGFLDAAALDSLYCKRQNVSFFNCSRLHAKIYASSSSSVVGSFNLTGRGLGLANDFNLESYSRNERPDPYSDTLMNVIEAESDPITPLLMKTFQRIEVDRRDSFDTISDLTSSIYWFPSFRRPHLLYGYYSKRNFTPTSSVSSDLRVLRPPPDLSEEEFNQFIRYAILRYPILRSLIAGKVVSQSVFSQSFLSAGLDQEEYSELDQLYITFYRWVHFFFPEFSSRAEYFLEAK
jgi:hypothetical protein